MSATYTFATKPLFMGHSQVSELPLWFGDYEETDDMEIREFNVIDAMAASGDYFVTLATRLDKVAQGLMQDSSEQIELEHLIKTMFYMQDHYRLVHKRKKS
jgi:hypothetical protein